MDKINRSKPRLYQPYPTQPAQIAKATHHHRVTCACFLSNMMMSRSRAEQPMKITIQARRCAKARQAVAWPLPGESRWILEPSLEPPRSRVTLDAEGVSLQAWGTFAAGGALARSRRCRSSTAGKWRTLARARTRLACRLRAWERQRHQARLPTIFE